MITGYGDNKLTTTRMDGMMEIFDFVGMLGYAGNVERTMDGIRECRSVGIEPQMFWNVRTAYLDVVDRHVVHTRAMGRMSYLSITLGHLNMVKCALEMGAKRALFFEDDIRFLKDETVAKDIVDSIPDDFDVLLFDWVHRAKASDEEIIGQKDAANGRHWGTFKNLRSCAAYGLTRRAMRMYVQLLENPCCGASKLKICDQYWPDMAASGLNCYAAFPNFCVQGAGGGATDHDGMWRNYARSGIKREDYHD